MVDICTASSKLFLVKRNNQEEDLISFLEQVAVSIPVICSLQSQKKKKTIKDKSLLSVDLNRFSEQGLRHSIGTGHLSCRTRKKLTRFAQEFGFHFIVYVVWLFDQTNQSSGNQPDGICFASHRKKVNTTSTSLLVCLTEPTSSLDERRSLSNKMTMLHMLKCLLKKNITRGKSLNRMEEIQSHLLSVPLLECLENY